MTPSAARSYTVEAPAFFAGVEEGAEVFVPRQRSLRCQGPMQGVIQRYGLGGCAVLSVGCGEAFEEFWFFKAACALTLNDLDASGQFERFLQTLPPASHAPLTFIVGDAAGIDPHLAPTGYDLVYISSFHPDEIRREDIGLRYRETRPLSQTLRLWTWPPGEIAYHPTLMQAVAHVKPGGLAIFQHYRGGVNVAVNRHYLRDVARQFAEHGLSLLEIYTYRRLPAVLLVVALKGSAEEAARRADALSVRPAITEFHGRFPGDERKDVIRIYRAGHTRLRERIYLAVWRKQWLVWRARRALRRTK